MLVEMPNLKNKKVDKEGHFLLFKLFSLNCQEFPWFCSNRRVCMYEEDPHYL